MSHLDVLGAKLRLAFVLGALLAALLPFLYVALIPLVAWALYWFGSASNTTSKVQWLIVAASSALCNLSKVVGSW